MNKTLKSSGLVAVLTWLVAHAAFAHTELSSSVPADEAVLDAAPKEIALHFSEPVRLTAVELSGDGASSDLGPLPGGMAERFAIGVPMLEAGRYVVNWRALSQDTHVVTGEIRFTIAREDAAPTPHSAQ